MIWKIEICWRIQYAVRFVPMNFYFFADFRIFFLFASDYYDDNTSKSGTSISRHHHVNIVNIGGQNPAKLDQTNEKVCIGLGGLGDSNF